MFCHNTACLSCLHDCPPFVFCAVQVVTWNDETGSMVPFGHNRTHAKEEVEGTGDGTSACVDHPPSALWHAHVCITRHVALLHCAWLRVARSRHARLPALASSCALPKDDQACPATMLPLAFTDCIHPLPRKFNLGRSAPVSPSLSLPLAVSIC